jgi:hypothetical protein
LEEPGDEEAKIFIDATPRHDSQSSHSRRSIEGRSLEDTKLDKVREEAVPNWDEMGDIAPFASVSSTTAYKARMVAPFSEPSGEGSSHRSSADNARAGKLLPRPKIFGPERVVKDPRVKALHERLMREMYGLATFGIMVSLKFHQGRVALIIVIKIFSAVIFSVPCGHHPL